jgi:hypothetical protein
MAMDVGGPRHYVAKAMEWLLILSALLNAATGGFAGTRSPESVARHETAVETVAIARSVAAVVVTTASRPAEGHWASPRSLELSQVAQVVAFPLPLETARLLE